MASRYLILALLLAVLVIRLRLIGLGHWFGLWLGFWVIAPPTIAVWLRHWFGLWLGFWVRLIAPPAIAVWLRLRVRLRLPILLEDADVSISVGLGISLGFPVSRDINLILSESTNKDASVLDQSDGRREGSRGSTFTPPVSARGQGKGTSLSKGRVSVCIGAGLGLGGNESRLGNRGGRGRGGRTVGHVSLGVVFSSTATHKEGSA
jgi:hypothetical protein